MADPTIPSNTTPQSSGTSGVDANLAALLCYLFPVLGGVVFLALEKKDQFVKFHAWQSIFLGGGAVAVWMSTYILWKILIWIPFLGWFLMAIISIVIGFGLLALWIICMIKAYQKEKWKIPVLGDMAEKQAETINF